MAVTREPGYAPLIFAATAEENPMEPQIVLFDARTVREGDLRVIQSITPVDARHLGRLGLGIVNTDLLK